MLFQLMIFVAFAAVAYFHYAEGLFSAMLSAILCLLAAVVSVGYYQSVAPYLAGKMPDQAEALALVGLFAVTYVVGRLLFDKLVPGNVRFPLLMDKIGAAVMGIFAGLFASGVMAIAAQTLPFGADIGGYSRQDLQERPNIPLSPEVVNSSRANGIDSFVTGELVGTSLGDTSHLNHLWLHQDEAVLAITRQFGAAGSALSYGQPVDEAHPDFLTELFGQRIGSPLSGKRSMSMDDKIKPFQVSGAYLLPKTPPSSLIMDAEAPAIRGDQPTPEIPGAGLGLVVLRVTFNTDPDAADTDGLTRLSPATVRLKAGKNDYYPVGTLVGGEAILKNRPDDELFVDASKGSKTVDFVFAVNMDADGGDLKTGDSKDKSIAFKDHSFLEIKRFATADLSGMTIAPEVPPTQVEGDFDKDGVLGGVLRKISVGSKLITNLSNARQQQAPAAKSRGKKGAQPADNAKSPEPGQSHDKSDDLLPPTPGNLIGM